MQWTSQIRPFTSRHFLLLCFLALLCLVFLVGGYSFSVFHALRDQKEKETLAADTAQAEMGALILADHQQGVMTRLETIASRTSFQAAVNEKNIPGLRRFLLPIIIQSRELVSAFLTDTSGKVVIQVPDNQPGAKYQIWTALAGAVNKDKRAVSSFSMGSTSSPRQVVMSVPIAEAGGEVLGYLGVIQRADFWHTFFSHMSARPGRAFFVFDQRGRLIASGPRNHKSLVQGMLDLAIRSRQEESLRKQTISKLVTLPLGGHKAFMSAAPAKGLGWVLVVVQDYGLAMASASALFRNMVLFLVFLFLFLGILGLLLISRYRLQKSLYERADQQARRLEREVRQRTDELEHSTARYRSLVEDLPDMVYEVDSMSRLSFVSRSARDILGFEPEEMVGRPRREYVLFKDRHKFDEEKARAEQGEVMSILALRHLTKDGDVRWLSIHSRGMTDEKGQVVGRRGVARDVTRQIMAEKRIHELSGKLIVAQEEERKRLALDLHDEMGQLLSALKIGLQSMAHSANLESSEELDRLIKLSQKIMDRVRALAYNLRPAILDSFGLVAAVQDLCDSVAESGAIRVTSNLQPIDDDAMAPELKLSLFRFFQEALNNVVRHSGSSRAVVSLSVQGGEIGAVVRDFGKGFDAEIELTSGSPVKCLGLLGMQERLGLLGGRLEIDSSNQGTTLVARAPWEMTDDE